jgi:hypothetical protein
MSKIKIVSNVINDELYSYSKSFYESMNYEKIVVSGQNKLYNFKFINYVILNKSLFDFDWMVYVDEDCFITNQKALEDLINYQIENNYSCSGMPDGGVIAHRFHNPVAINPFFMIMNINEIRKKYNIDEINKSMYGEDLNKYVPINLIKKEYTYKSSHDEILKLGYSPYGVVFDNFEPCYGFFFWLLRNNFKILYLDADEHDDGISTILKNHNDVPFAYHAWYGRLWNDENHKKRILNIINYCNTLK